MTERDLTDAELDTLFDTARAEVPEASPAFLERLADTARDAVTAHAPHPAPCPAARMAGRGRRLASLLGGWPGLGGLAAAGLTGVWIGLAPPDGMLDPLDLIPAAAGTAAQDADLWLGLDGVPWLEQEEG